MDARMSLTCFAEGTVGITRLPHTIELTPEHNANPTARGTLNLAQGLCSSQLLLT